MPTVDGFGPCRRDRVSTSRMEEGHMVLLGSSVVGAVGEMVGHLEAVVALAGIFKDLINHAAITGRFGVALQGEGPETGGGVSGTFHND